MTTPKPTILTTTITTVVDCNGTQHPVTTARQEGESDDDFYARHKQEVADQEAACGDT